MSSASAWLAILSERPVRVNRTICKRSQSQPMPVGAADGGAATPAVPVAPSQPIPAGAVRAVGAAGAAAARAAGAASANTAAAVESAAMMWAVFCMAVPSILVLLIWRANSRRILDRSFRRPGASYPAGAAKPRKEVSPGPNRPDRIRTRADVAAVGGRPRDASEAAGGGTGPSSARN